MSDDDKIVHFMTKEDRSKIAAIDADQARWHLVHARLIEVMATSELTYGGVTSAALRALLEVLQEGNDMSLQEAKDYIAARLKLFR